MEQASLRANSSVVFIALGDALREQTAGFADYCGGHLAMLPPSARHLRTRVCTHPRLHHNRRSMHSR